MKKFFYKLFYFPTFLGVSLIKLYQKTLSPDHGLFKARFPYGYCRHFPSCSEYTKQAIEKHGLTKGVGKGLSRIIRCNPWTKPKIDLISPPAKI